MSMVRDWRFGHMRNIHSERSRRVRAQIPLIFD